MNPERVSNNFDSEFEASLGAPKNKMDTSKKAGHTKRNSSPTKKDQRVIKAKKKNL